jgi:hypothetical protein
VGLSLFLFDETQAAKRPVSGAYMFVFRNEIIEETNDDLRYPRKQFFEFCT